VIDVQYILYTDRDMYYIAIVFVINLMRKKLFLLRPPSQSDGLS